MLILQIVCFIMFTVGTYVLAAELLHLPSRKAGRNLVHTQKENLLRKLYIKISTPLISMLAKIIRIPSYMRVKYMRDLERAGMLCSPEAYVSNAIVTGFLTAASSVIFALLGIPIVAMGMAVLGVLLYFRELSRVNNLLKELDAKILKALPHFVRMVTESLKSDKNICKIFGKYIRDVPETPLKGDLNRFLAFIDAGGNQEQALRILDNTLGVSAMSGFITGLIEVSKGVDQTLYFEMVSRDMKVLNTENIKRTVAKRPAKIKKATIAMIVCLFLLYLVPMVMQVLQGIQMFD